jgi:UDP-N-acetylglucosamine:LPS N-acetylglucosamine transferase
MGSDEQAARIGQLMIEYNEAKKEIALLKAELLETAERFEDFGVAVRREQSEVMIAKLKSLKPEELIETVARLDSARNKLERTRETLKACGIDV